MGTTPAITSAAQALELLEFTLGYLAAADPAQLSTQTQAECLAALERATAVTIAARTGLLGAFTAARGHTEDADYSPRSWLIHKTRITKGAATGHTAWTRRARATPASWPPWPPGTSPSPTPAPSAPGPAGSPTVTVTPPTRS